MNSTICAHTLAGTEIAPAGRTNNNLESTMKETYLDDADIGAETILQDNPIWQGLDAWLGSSL